MTTNAGEIDNSSVDVETAGGAGSPEQAEHAHRIAHFVFLAVSVVLWIVPHVLGGTQDADPVSLDELLWATMFLPLQVVGLIVLRAHPENAVGRSLLISPFLLALSGALLSQGQANLTRVAGGIEEAGTWHQAGPFFAADIINALGNGGLLLAFFRFPDGHSLGGLWRLGERLLFAGIALTAVGTILTPSLDHEIAGHTIAVPNPVLPRGVGQLSVLNDVAGLLILIAVILGMGSVVARYRQGRVSTRLQLRWVVYPLLVGVLLQGLIWLSDVLLGTRLGTGLASVGVGIVFTVGIPAGILMAITRSRLYEIDRILSRTVSYAVLTAVLVGVYALGVLGIGALLPGERSDLLVAGSTLAVAALFRPLRSRIQGLVDRRFNRSRYDAARTVEGFATRLRDEVDLDSLTNELKDVIDHTFRPEAATVWVREVPA